MKRFVVTIRVVRGRPVGGVARPTVKRGTVVRFVVVTDAGEAVHLHGLRIEKPIVRGRAVLDLRATVPGRFDLELHHPDALLARLTVTP